MDHQSIFSAVAAALALLIAGCAENAAQTADGGVPAPGTITDPGNLTGLLDSRPHVHDYWRGETTQMFAQADVTLESGTPCSSPLAEYDSRTPCAPIHPEGTVIPGTAYIDVHVTWSSPDAAQRSIWMDWIDPSGGSEAEPLWASGNFTIPVSNATWDPPHSRISFWQFSISVSGPPESPPASLDVHVEMTLHRIDGTLPVAPAHPDFWGNRTSLRACQSSGAVHDIGHVRTYGSEWIEQCIRNDPPVVPLLTEQIRIRINYTSSSPPSLHYEPTMDWRGADKRVLEQEDVPPTSKQVAAQGFWEWIIDVKPEQWDSPYVNRTQWGFGFDWADSPSPIGGPYVMDGDYVFFVEYIRGPPA